jgi:hypothetical protein
VSLSPYIAACEKVYGTNIEGEWDAVFAAIRRCHEVVHGMGAPRIATTGQQREGKTVGGNRGVGSNWPFSIMQIVKTIANMHKLVVSLQHDTTRQ